MKHETAIKQGLEPIYPEVHHLGTRIFYDPKEGKYYDASTDLYLPDDNPFLNNFKEVHSWRLNNFK